MTAEMQASLTRELEAAQYIEDPERRRDALITVLTHMVAALIDCNRKTAERVKSLVAEADAAKYKLQGAQIAWRIIRYIVAAGGGALVLKFAETQIGG